MTREKHSNLAVFYFALQGMNAVRALNGEREVHMNMKWWKAAGIRALKTFCQTAIATIGTSAVLSEINWVTVGSASVVAALLSLLTSVAGLPEVDGQ